MPKLTYAQNCEDLVLQVLLPKKRGFYVDVGANMPSDDSVTKIFYDRGWSGINIEPMPKLYEDLIKERPRDTSLNVGISDKPGELVLRQYQEGYHGWSTFSESIKGMDSRKKKSYLDLPVKIDTLSNIFTQHHVKKIDFLKVDVEGLEYEVLAGNDWTKWRPTVVVVENTPGKWMELLLKNGYSVVFFDGLNYYFAQPTLRQELILRELVVQVEAAYQKEFSELNTILLHSREQLRLTIERPEDYFSGVVLLKSIGRQLWRRLRKST